MVTKTANQIKAIRLRAGSPDQICLAQTIFKITENNPIGELTGQGEVALVWLVNDGKHFVFEDDYTYYGDKAKVWRTASFNNFGHKLVRLT